MRGGISTEPPVHLVLDMDFQPKMRTQAKTDFEGWSRRAHDAPAGRRPEQSPWARRWSSPRARSRSQAGEPRRANKAFVTKNPLPLDHRLRLGARADGDDRARPRALRHPLRDLPRLLRPGRQRARRVTARGSPLDRRDPQLPFRRRGKPGADNRVANLRRRVLRSHHPRRAHDARLRCAPQPSKTAGRSSTTSAPCSNLSK
jgi:hypothetical protein